MLIDINFDLIRDKIYDVVDALIEKGVHLEDAINRAFDDNRVIIDLESDWLMRQ